MDPGGGSPSRPPWKFVVMAFGLTVDGGRPGGAAPRSGVPPGVNGLRVRLVATEETRCGSVAMPRPPVRPNATSTGIITGLTVIGVPAMADEIT
jgi:hypothetical protein